MRTDIAGWLALVVVGLAAGRAVAQPERYELGQRLKRFEQAWEETKDPAARKRALAIVKKASGQFLSLQLGEAGQTLDEARWALLGQTPTDAERFLEGLYVVPKQRVVAGPATGTTGIKAQVRRLYPYKGEGPPRCSVAVYFYGRWPGMDFVTTAVIDKVPVSIEVAYLPTSPGDHQLMIDGNAARSPALRYPVCTVSLVPGLDERLANWKRVANGGPVAVGESIKLEQATVRELAAQLVAAAEGTAFEIDTPAQKIDAQISTIAQLAVSGVQYFTPDRPGDFRLSVPTGKNIINPCRLLVPKGLNKGKPTPLVVALHGAGGSENLFFEGYGNGHIVKECEKRGWMLLAPRGGLLGAAPVAAIIDKLAERYPIDPKRIFLVGHSMGAGQAIELAQQHPGKFAAVASLGGAGRVRKKEPFADLPVFVGVGDQDFALKGSRALHKALTDAGAKRVTYKEYPDLEHLVIVREALPDVFALWDEIAKK